MGVLYHAVEFGRMNATGLAATICRAVLATARSAEIFGIGALPVSGIYVPLRVLTSDGRVADLSSLDRALVTGIAGSGKSALARHVALQHLSLSGSCALLL